MMTTSNSPSRMRSKTIEIEFASTSTSIIYTSNLHSILKDLKTSPRTHSSHQDLPQDNHDTDIADNRSKLQAHTLDGIAVGRDDSSNSIMFYNPITSSYYRPPAFLLD